MAQAGYFFALYGFYPNLSAFFQTRFGFSALDAGHIISLPYFVGALCAPCLGAGVARFGRQPLLM